MAKLGYQNSNEPIATGVGDYVGDFTPHALHHSKQQIFKTVT